MVFYCPAIVDIINMDISGGCIMSEKEVDAADLERRQASLRSIYETLNMAGVMSAILDGKLGTINIPGVRDMFRKHRIQVSEHGNDLGQYLKVAEDIPFRTEPVHAGYPAFNDMMSRSISVLSLHPETAGGRHSMHSIVSMSLGPLETRMETFRRNWMMAQLKSGAVHKAYDDIESANDGVAEAIYAHAVIVDAMEKMNVPEHIQEDVVESLCQMSDAGIIHKDYALSVRDGLMADVRILNDGQKVEKDSELKM